MPKAPPRPCNEPRCSSMAVDQVAGVKIIKKRRGQPARQTRPPHDRGYGWKLAKDREKLILKRDGHWMCQELL